MRIPRTRGAISGLLLVLAGLWGGLIPLVGPSFDFGFTPDESFEMTEGRFYLSLLPGIATFVGGLILLMSANRVAAALGGWLALAGGAWFVIGSQTSRLWNDSQPQVGAPIDGGGGTLEQLTYFVGLGAVVTALAAFALGRLAVKAVRDVELEREHDRDVPPDRDRDRDPGHDRAPAAREASPAETTRPTETTRPAETTRPTEAARPADAEPVTTSTRPAGGGRGSTPPPAPEGAAPERRGRFGRLLGRRH